VCGKAAIEAEGNVQRIEQVLGRLAVQYSEPLLYIGHEHRAGRIA
jgi:hypothetical protein